MIMDTIMCPQCTKLVPKNRFRPKKNVCFNCYQKWYNSLPSRKEQMRKWESENRERCKKVSKIWQMSPRGVYGVIKTSAKLRNIEFGITLTDFLEWYKLQPQICSYCKRTTEEVIKNKDIKKNVGRLSIDRKDNRNGYSIENICLCCFRCNMIKASYFSFEEMLEIGRIIAEKEKNRK